MMAIIPVEARENRSEFQYFKVQSTTGCGLIHIRLTFSQTRSVQERQTRSLAATDDKGLFLKGRTTFSAQQVIFPWLQEGFIR